MSFLLYTVFFLSAVLLILIILLQEGKGGGLSEAFGGAGAETFGVRSGGINRFTFGVFAVFVLPCFLAAAARTPPKQSCYLGLFVHRGPYTSTGLICIKRPR